MMLPDIETREAPGPKTTVAQILWMTPPVLDFRKLVGDMIDALTGSANGERQVDWDGDSVALIDFGGSRVGLSFAQHLNREVAAAMTVTVGYGQGGDCTKLAENQALLARLIVQRITARHPALRVVWSHSQRNATRAMLAELDASLLRKGTEVALPSRAARAQHFAGADDLPRFFDRLEASLAARRGIAPGPSTAELDAEATERPQRDRLRLSAHLLDAALMVIALPIGAAMMVWSLARGADVTTSARTLAVMAVVVSVLQSVGTFAPIAAIVSPGF